MELRLQPKTWQVNARVLWISGVAAKSSALPLTAAWLKGKGSGDGAQRGSESGLMPSHDSSGAEAPPCPNRVLPTRAAE